jgi:rRNA maturation RNase YbeY
VIKNSILFFEEGIHYTLQHKKRIRKWIHATAEAEGKICGSINYIYCSDEYLRQLNIKYLNHNTLTDIITFDNSEKKSRIEGDIFISIDRIRENAKHFQVRFVNELYRVMIHGILHLSGYKDSSSDEKSEMRQKEDYYLSLLPEFFK